jgi:hypothetical protein
MDQQPKPPRRLFGIIDLIGVTFFAALFGIPFLMNSLETKPVDPGSTSDAQSTSSDAGEAESNNAPAKRWSKSEFDKYIANRTKAQVRDEFGPPNSVDDDSDSWYYWHLPIYDTDASIQVRTTIIRFVGTTGSDDFAVGAKYE